LREKPVCIRRREALSSRVLFSAHHQQLAIQLPSPDEGFKKVKKLTILIFKALKTLENLRNNLNGDIAGSCKVPNCNP
jgi:hypothetical protein